MMENISVTPVGLAKAAADRSRVRISTTPEERTEYVRLFEESGKSPADFCRELGLAESTFAVWRKQVRGPAPANLENLTFTEVPQSMVEAALAANAAAAVPPGAVTIHLANGTRLEVTAGTDATWLAQLATALRA
jgi:transposase-like protein